ASKTTKMLEADWRNSRCTDCSKIIVRLNLAKDKISQQNTARYNLGILLRLRDPEPPTIHPMPRGFVTQNQAIETRMN
ncbi:MAG: hypothetical protein EBX66_00325, partial [Betaproteobacteria bacterium]|nr:hypothetical protein [Betaproteobacteria bacterium]